MWHQGMSVLQFMACYTVVRVTQGAIDGPVLRCLDDDGTLLCVSTALSGVPLHIPARTRTQLPEGLQSVLQRSQDLIQVLLIHLQERRTHVHLFGILSISGQFQCHVVHPFYGSSPPEAPSGHWPSIMKCADQWKSCLLPVSEGKALLQLMTSRQPGLVLQEP